MLGLKRQRGNLTSREIGAELCMLPSTVDVHMHNLIKKLRRAAGAV